MVNGERNEIEGMCMYLNKKLWVSFLKILGPLPVSVMHAVEYS